MSRKSKKNEEHIDESWLLPYADLLTLLLAVFIVMFSISNVDKDKFEKLSLQFNAILSGSSGVMDTSANNAAIKEDEMLEIMKSIEEEIKSGGYSDNVTVALNKEGIVISIQDVVLFNSGDAVVLSSVHPLLLNISRILSGLDNNIRVIGHTDNVPIHNERFRSNWDLSAIRAINVAEFLIDQGNLRPERLAIEGYSKYSPKYDNSTEEGRAKNRRVEIFLIR